MAVRDFQLENRGPLALALQIEQQLQVDELTTRLMSYPEQIARQQEAVQAVKQAVEETKGEVQLAESLLMAEIQAAVDPRTGKAQFSNDTARKAELAQRQAGDEGYQSALQRLREAESALCTAQFELDRLFNEFSALKAVASMTAGRLHLMAGLS